MAQTDMQIYFETSFSFLDGFSGENLAKISKKMAQIDTKSFKIDILATLLIPTHL